MLRQGSTIARRCNKLSLPRATVRRDVFRRFAAASTEWHFERFTERGMRDACRFVRRHAASKAQPLAQAPEGDSNPLVSEREGQEAGAGPCAAIPAPAIARMIDYTFFLGLREQCRARGTPVARVWPARRSRWGSDAGNRGAMRWRDRLSGGETWTPNEEIATRRRHLSSKCTQGESLRFPGAL